MLRNLIVPLVLTCAACSPPPAQDGAASQATPPQAAALSDAAPVSGVGTVTAIDAAAGTVSINHDPIAALGWPAMTMQFTVEDSAALQNLAVGDRVVFDLKSAAESSTITSLRKQ